MLSNPLSLPPPLGLSLSLALPYYRKSCQASRGSRGAPHRVSVQDLQSQMTCWKVLLSHVAGFAAINSWLCFR